RENTRARAEVAAGSHVVAMSGLARGDGDGATRRPGDRGKARKELAGRRPRIARHEADEEPVEERGRAVVDRDQAVRVQGPAVGDRAELGEERSSCGDEQRYRLVRSDVRTGKSVGQLVGRGD